MAVRAISISNMLKKKHETFDFEAPWSFAFGVDPSDSGIWLIWGKEKNGKTTFALMLARYLSTMKKVAYVSAEEGTDKEFTEACLRAGLSTTDKNLNFYEYIELVELRQILKKRNSPDVVFLDNITAYRDELKQNAIQNLKTEFPNKLFVFLAHEERKEPSPSQARNCKRLAKVIVHVVGLKAIVSGRVTGGEYLINEEKAQLFWGESNNESDE